jgi:hypothetical protein
VVERREGEIRVVVDVPSGRLETTAVVEGGKVRSVTFRNVPSFVWGTGIRAGDQMVDVAFGGAFYATLEERVSRSELPRLIALGRELKRALEAEHEIVHPLEPELRDVYGVIFWQHEGDAPFVQRNVTVFADGEVDRSPCGSDIGTAGARRVSRLRRGAGPPSPDRRPELRRTRRGRGGGRGMTRVVEVGQRLSHGRELVFTLDPDDPLGEGFPPPVAPASVRCAWHLPATRSFTRRQATDDTTLPSSARAGPLHPPLRRALPGDDAAGAQFEHWWRDSFRKVCLRAEPREWEAVRELDHERVGDIACLPPVRRGLRDRVLVRMQALSDEAGVLPPPPEPLPNGLTLAVATHLGMSAGKVLAQIGHAALRPT